MMSPTIHAYELIIKVSFLPKCSNDQYNLFHVKLRYRQNRFSLSNGRKVFRMRLEWFMAWENIFLFSMIHRWWYSKCWQSVYRLDGFNLYMGSIAWLSAVSWLLARKKTATASCDKWFSKKVINMCWILSATLDSTRIDSLRWIKTLKHKFRAAKGNSTQEPKPFDKNSGFALKTSSN